MDGIFVLEELGMLGLGLWLGGGGRRGRGEVEWVRGSLSFILRSFVYLFIAGKNHPCIIIYTSIYVSIPLPSPPL